MAELFFALESGRRCGTSICGPVCEKERWLISVIQDVFCDTSLENILFIPVQDLAGSLGLTRLEGRKVVQRARDYDVGAYLRSRWSPVDAFISSKAHSCDSTRVALLQGKHQSRSLEKVRFWRPGPRDTIWIEYVIQQFECSCGHFTKRSPPKAAHTHAHTHVQ